MRANIISQYEHRLGFPSKNSLVNELFCYLIFFLLFITHISLESEPENSTNTYYCIKFALKKNTYLASCFAIWFLAHCAISQDYVWMIYLKITCDKPFRQHLSCWHFLTLHCIALGKVVICPTKRFIHHPFIKTFNIQP